MNTLNQLKRQMEKNDYCIHLQRKWVNRPEEFPKAEYQRLSYDLTNQDRMSIHEIHMVLKYFSTHSNGEFKYWITDYSKLEEGKQPWIDDPSSIIYSTDLDIEENEGHTEDIHTLHSGEPETNTKGSAE